MLIRIVHFEIEMLDTQTILATTKKNSHTKKKKNRKQEKRFNLQKKKNITSTNSLHLKKK